MEPDHPGAVLHRRGKPVDELLGRERRELAVEAQHDRVVDPGGADQSKLLLKGSDRGRTVCGVEDTTRVWLERDQRGLAFDLRGTANRVPDYVEMAEVDPIEAADRQRHRSDWRSGKSEMDLQLSTFFGTKVRRSGSVCPSAISRPPPSCARTGPGPAPWSTRPGLPSRPDAA